MQLRLRIKNKDGIVRIENSTKIQEVMINEDFLHPENESIALGFRNRDSSGIIEFTVKEFEKLAESVKRKMHLIKGFKTLGRSGAIKFNKCIPTEGA